MPWVRREGIYAPQQRPMEWCNSGGAAPATPGLTIRLTQISAVAMGGPVSDPDRSTTTNRTQTMILTLKGLVITGAAGRDFHDPAGVNPGLSDVLWSLVGVQRPGDVAAVANLVIACHKRDLGDRPDTDRGTNGQDVRRQLDRRDRATT
jgi:hypothetical protein